MKKNNFDFLRFFFAFIVILGHLMIISGSKPLQILMPYVNTHLSVTAFFCISGYLITNSYCNTSSLSRYLVKRAARLLPAYLLVVVTSAVLLSFLSTYSLKAYFCHIGFYKYLFANLTFLNFLNPTLPGVFIQHGAESSVNGALWTLKIEVAFYLLLPFILYFIRKFDRKFIPLLILYSISLFYQFFFDLLFAKTGNGLYQILSHQLPAYLTYFVSGIAMYYYYEYFVKYKSKLIVLGITLFFLERSIGISILTPIALSIMVFGFAYSLKFLNSFAKHGDLSYGIYIYHCPIINLAVYFNLFEMYNPFFVAFMVILLVLLISYFSWHLLEKKILDIAHKIQIRCQ